MKEAVRKIRAALSKQAIVPNLMYYLVKDGYITANNGRMTAAAPFPCSLTFLVPGDEFETLLNRLDDNIVLTLTDSRVTLTSGRMRGSIQILSEDTVFYPLPDPKLYTSPPEKFLPALRTVRPFISDNATREWALCAALQEDRILATNNVSLVRAECPGLPHGETLLPCWAVDFLLASSAELTGMQLHPNAACFRWDDGTWMRTQLIDGGFPTQVDDLLSKITQQPKTEITEEWRAAYTKLVGLCEDKISLFADKMTGQRGMTEVEYAIDTPTPDGGVSNWNLYLTPVIEAATHWDPTMWPQPAPFIGPGFCGLICGRT